MGHLQKNGFIVESIDVSHTQLMALKDQQGVPKHLHACHTGLVEDYVIEGHVPATVITRLLKERPPVSGLAVPGMPIGSPGMEGPNPKPYDIFSFNRKGEVQVYEHVIP